VFKRWCSGTLASDRHALNRSATLWREIDCSDCLGLKILFNATAEGIEVETQLRVEARIERVLELLTVAEERRKWDERTKDIVTVDQSGNMSILLMFDMPGRENFCTLDCQLTRDSPDHASLVLTTKDHSESQIRIKSTYSISTIRNSDPSDSEEDEEDTEESQGLASLALSDSCTQMPHLAPTRCLVTNKLTTNSLLARAFASDIIGEAQTFKSSWMQFKRLAEGFLKHGDIQSELNRAMDRKAVVARSRLGTFRGSGTFSPRSSRACASQGGSHFRTSGLKK